MRGTVLRAGHNISAIRTDQNVKKERNKICYQIFPKTKEKLAKMIISEMKKAQFRHLGTVC